jgi:hypothetical protein
MTLRIIFMGLLAIVPSGEDGGRSVLLLDTVWENYQLEDGQVVPPHIPFVLMLKGTCDSCSGCPDLLTGVLPAGLLPASDVHRLNAARRQAAEGEDPDPDVAGIEELPLPVRKRLALRLTGGGLSNQVNVVGADSPITESSPQDIPQARHYDWTSSMRRVQRGSRRVLKQCTEGPRDLPRPSACPIISRFELSSGELSACHLFHNQEGTRFFEFEFGREGKKSKARKQALADAVMVEYRGLDSVSLEYSEINKLSSSFSIALKPEDDCDQITLVVGNLALSSAAIGNEPPSQSANTDRHFEIFYQVSRKFISREKRLLPVRVDSSPSDIISDLPCETEFDLLSRYFRSTEAFLGSGTMNPPHNPEECILTGFP